MSEERTTDRRGPKPERALSESKPGVVRKLSVAAARTLLQFPVGGGGDKAKGNPLTGAFRSTTPSFGAAASASLDPVGVEAPRLLPGSAFGGVSTLEVTEEAPSSSARSLDAAQNVSFGEIFDNVVEPLWPVGGAIVVRAAVALQDLKRQSDRSEHAPTTGLTRTALTSWGTVEFDGEYPGDAIAIGLLSTWLYRFCTGRFPGQNERLVPSQVNPKIPKWVDGICVRGLSYDEETRYKTVKQFHDDLEERVPRVARTEIGSLVRRVLARLCPSEETLAGELTGALRVLTLAPPREPSRSYAWLWTSLALVAVAAGFAAWKFLFQA